MRRTLVSGLALMASVAVATNAAAATLDYRQQLSSLGDRTRCTGPAVRNEPYPPRFYGDVSRGIKAVAG